MPTAELSQFQFLTYKVRSLSFEGLKPFHAEQEGRFQVNFETQVQLFEQEDVPEGLSLSLVGLRLEIVWESEPLFDLKIAVEGLFQRHQSMPEDVYQHFSEVLAPSVLYAQLRPIVRQITTEAGFDFQLPLINMVETIKKQKASRSSEDTL